MNIYYLIIDIYNYINILTMALITNNIIDRSQLPYVEQFRPTTFDEILSHDNNIKILKKLILRHDIPHLLFYGPPGTGKTSTIEVYMNELYGKEYTQYMVMNLNASEERGIDTIRIKIKDFVSASPLFNKPNSPKYKFVILDEADAMTNDAQGMLKKFIEYYTPYARFCLICNCNKKINPAIQSRCSIFNFPPIDYKSAQIKINSIATTFNFVVTDGAINILWKLSNGDMRKILHMLQVISINNKLITADIITTIKKYPSIKDIDKIFSILCNRNLHISIKKINNIIKNKNYSHNDLLKELTEKVNDAIINNQIEHIYGVKVLLLLRDIEINISITLDTDIQLLNIICAFT
jgi:replication factor C subunit 3/5